MKKHRLFLVCGLALFMVGCQASQSSKTTESSKASQETSVKKEDQVLERGQWEDKLYKKLSNVIKDPAIVSGNDNINASLTAQICLCEFNLLANGTNTFSI